MKNPVRFVPVLAASALVAAGIGCGSSTTVHSETKTRQVGSTMVSETKTEANTPSGETDVNSKSVVGTVTKYEPGHEIELVVNGSDKEEFDLDQKNSKVIVDAGVVVGSKVRVDRTMVEDGATTITISLIQP